MASIIVVTLAFVGFFTGTSDRRGQRASPATSSPRPLVAGFSTGAGAVPRYADMRKADYRANAALYLDAPQVLARGIPDPLAPVELSDEERARAVEARRQRRAYDGAPPTIPHAVAQLEPTGCLVCHERGANVAGRIAPPVSHPRYTTCTQCHVVSSAPRPLGNSEAKSEVSTETGPENRFEGHAWGKGARAWAGAPPTMPHPTWMREECTSCHGPAGRLGLRSSHPWRASCQQCHAPSAALDQRPLSPPEARP